MEKKTYAGDEMTPDVIAALKEKHGEVYRLVVADATVKFDPHMVPTDDDAPLEGIAGFIRKPNDKELGFAMSKLPAFLEAGKVLVKNCWVGGDDRIKTEAALLNAAALQVIELLEVRQAQLKKL